MKSAEEKCCDRPDVQSRWIYTGDRLDNAVGWCRNCDAGWKLDRETRSLVREEVKR
jgi:hypothetical protein